LRIVALGDVDELNSVLGLLNAKTLPAQAAKDLLAVQHDLFDIGAELCIPGRAALTTAHLARLDERLAHYNSVLPPLSEFILPGGSRSAALAHLARTTCRRAERAVVALACRNRERSGAALFEPAVRSDVRAGSLPEPRQNVPDIFWSST
jgi:cob(I)alamin adenosyltransferase